MDPASEFALGSELLAAADSPDSFARGAALVEEAARKGNAEASAMLATLEAIGAGRRQDWDRALNQLEIAAERGSSGARAQLRLLAGPDSGVSRDWSSLRSGLDPARFLEAPARTALSESPRIGIFEGFATPGECRWVIERMGPRLGPAMIWDSATGMGRIDPSRSNSAVELRLPEMDVVLALLRARISAATHLPEAIFEVPQVMHYAPGQEFRPHHDFLDTQQPGPAADVARRGQRIGTFLIFLNEDFEGGETEFPKAGLSWRGRTGDALFFANVTPDGKPDPLTLHAGRPPTRGEKWIFSQWIRDRLPGPPLSNPAR
jgi:hypothetical protein